ncbi:hypothetical protein Z949_414 [Sulfitobacter guttiformis KCTC 32187]|nr:hypothetical protein Z949_414 [Sulfitobacter guttiformis KCTC 32187]
MSGIALVGQSVRRLIFSGALRWDQVHANGQKTEFLCALP